MRPLVIVRLAAVFLTLATTLLSTHSKAAERVTSHRLYVAVPGIRDYLEFGGLEPPRQITSIEVRDQPGWITFSLDGRHAWPSTGEVIDVPSRKIVARLADEHGVPVHSEKLLEIDFSDGRAVRCGDQFGLGRAR